MGPRVAAQSVSEACERADGRVRASLHRTDCAMTVEVVLRR